MPAGRCDRRITIESRPETQNSRGEPIPGAPVVVATVWAEKVPLRIGEGKVADQDYATADYRWELRHYVAGITPKMQVNEGGVLYDISGVTEVGRRKGLHLTVVQRGV